MVVVPLVFHLTGGGEEEVLIDEGGLVMGGERAWNADLIHLFTFELNRHGARSPVFDTD